MRLSLSLFLFFTAVLSAQNKVCVFVDRAGEINLPPLEGGYYYNRSAGLALRSISNNETSTFPITTDGVPQIGNSSFEIKILAGLSANNSDYTESTTLYKPLNINGTDYSIPFNVNIVEGVATSTENALVTVYGYYVDDSDTFDLVSPLDSDIASLAWPDIPSDILDFLHDNPALGTLRTVSLDDAGEVQGVTHNNPFYDPSAEPNKSYTEIDVAEAETALDVLDAQEAVDRLIEIYDRTNSSYAIYNEETDTLTSYDNYNDETTTYEQYSVDPVEVVTVGSGSGSGSSGGGSTIINNPVDFTLHPLNQGDYSAYDDTADQNFLTNRIELYTASIEGLSDAFSAFAESIVITPPSNEVGDLTLNLDLGIIKQNISIDPSPYSFIRSILLVGITLYFIGATIKLFRA